MSKFYVTKNGVLQRTGDCPQSQIATQAQVGEEVYEGDPPPSVFPPPPPAPTLNELKAAKWAVIKASARVASAGGFTAAGFNWDSDLETQQALTITIQDMAAGDTTVWYTAEGNAKTLTFAQIKALGRAMRNHLQAQRDKAATLRAQIAAATTQTELDAIVW